MTEPKPPVLFVVSDGRGDTCRQVLEAALVQFPGPPPEVVVWPETRTVEQIDTLIGAAAANDATVFYSLVSSETRTAMQRAADSLVVPVVDVLGQPLSALHDVFRREPSAEPGLYYASDRERFDLHAAIDYTLKHDDGERAHEWDGADVLIVGVSRASKSTTCFTLAYRGVRAANVPLIVDRPLPSQLDTIDPAKVVGLRINVPRLMRVREARAAHLRHAHTQAYVDKREIVREVRFANQLMDSRGWRSFDASYMAVEEIAREVMRLRRL